MTKLILILLLFFVLVGCTDGNEIVSSELAEKGTVLDVEYLQGGYRKSAKTVIRFDDGSSFVLFGHWSIPDKEIEIYKQTHERGYVTIEIKETKSE